MLEADNLIVAAYLPGVRGAAPASRGAGNLMRMGPTSAQLRLSRLIGAT